MSNAWNYLSFSQRFVCQTDADVVAHKIMTLRNVKVASIVVFVPFVDVIAQTSFWTQLGPINTAIVERNAAMVYHTSGYIFAATSPQGAMRYSISTQKWTLINKGLVDSLIVSLAVNQNNEIFAGTSRDGIFKSTDLGNSWGSLLSSPKGYPVITLAINAKGYIFAGTFGGGAYRSTDSGNTWKQINSGITSSIVTSFLFDSDNITYAGTDTGGGIFRSINDGDSWTQITEGLTWFDLPLEHGPVIWGMARDSNGTIYVALVNGGIHRSTDRGNSWTRINNGMKDTATVAIVIDSKDQIFIGAYYTRGIYRSTNFRDNWTLVPLELYNVWSFALDSSGCLYCGTVGGGVFRSTQPVTSVPSIEDPPSSYVLLQNYSNPFNSSTSLSFSIPNNAGMNRTTLTVYNILGQEIAKLFDKEVSSGSYKVQWDGKDSNGKISAAGIYIYRLTVGDKFAQSNRMILLK